VKEKRPSVSLAIQWEKVEKEARKKGDGTELGNKREGIFLALGTKVCGGDNQAIGMTASTAKRRATSTRSCTRVRRSGLFGRIEKSRAPSRRKRIASKHDLGKS